LNSFKKTPGPKKFIQTFGVRLGPGIRAPQDGTFSPRGLDAISEKIAEDSNEGNHFKRWGGFRAWASIVSRAHLHARIYFKRPGDRCEIRSGGEGPASTSYGAEAGALSAKDPLKFSPFHRHITSYEPTGGVGGGGPASAQGVPTANAREWGGKAANFSGWRGPQKGLGPFETTPRFAGAPFAWKKQHTGVGMVRARTGLGGGPGPRAPSRLPYRGVGGPTGSGHLGTDWLNGAGGGTTFDDLSGGPGWGEEKSGSGAKDVVVSRD